MQTSLMTPRHGQASIKKYEEKYFTGSSAFPTTSRRQIWNRNCSYSPCGPCPTRRGRFCEQQWPGCVTWCQVRGGAPHLHLFFSGECWETQDSPSRKSGVAESIELNPQVADLGGTLGLFLGFSFLGLFKHHTPKNWIFGQEIKSNCACMNRWGIPPDSSNYPNPIDIQWFTKFELCIHDHVKY